MSEKETLTANHVETAYRPKDSEIEENAVENGVPKWVFNAEKRTIILRCMSREEYETTTEYLMQLIKVRKGLQDRVIYPDENKKGWL